MKLSNVMGHIVSSCMVFISICCVATSTIKEYDFQTSFSGIKRSIPLSEQTVMIDERALKCMALNMYFEARNQDSEIAMAAVGYTVLNRVNSKQYPNAICDVVFQGRKMANGNYVRNKCQFSWVCDGIPDSPNNTHPVEARAWERANAVAVKVILGTIDNPIGNATMYHATYVNPYWVSAFKKVTKIEDHIFYTKA